MVIVIERAPGGKFFFIHNNRDVYGIMYPCKHIYRPDIINPDWSPFYDRPTETWRCRECTPQPEEAAP